MTPKIFTNLLLYFVISFTFRPEMVFSRGKSLQCKIDKCNTIDCSHKRTICLLKAGEKEKALDLLKNEKEILQQKKEYHLLLAKTYLETGNTFWALSTLENYLEINPEECETLSWVAWINIITANIPEAKEILQNQSCINSNDETIASRFKLLSAFALIQEKTGRGKSTKKLDKHTFEKAEKIKKIFPEDISLYKYNRSISKPDFELPLTFKLEAGSGYTTNALMGAPSDPRYIENMDSPLLTLDFLSRLYPLISHRINPLLEATIKSTYYFNDEGAEKETPENYSLLLLGWKPGFKLLPYALLKTTIAYHGDISFLNKPSPFNDEAPIIFYEGHRGEIEFELGNLTIFAGGGRRIFDQKVRTRWEFDGGIGGVYHPLKSLSFLGAATMHYFLSENKGYNVFGVSWLLSGLFNIWKGLNVKILGLCSIDNYPDSEGYFKEGKIRKEILIKAQTQIWTPSWKGLSAGISYEFSDKISTIKDYSFLDHRIMLKIRWNYGFDIFAPEKSAPPLHVPLDYGLGEKETRMIADKIQDLLRQDESITRGSSCKD